MSIHFKNSKLQFYRRVNLTLVIILDTLVILLLAAAIYSVRILLLGALIGLGIGILLSPSVSFLKTKYKIPKAISTSLFMLTGLGAIGGLAYFLVTTVSTQIAPLISRAPGILHHLQDKIRNPQISNYLQNIHPERSLGDAAQTLFTGVRLGASSIATLVFISFIAIYFCVKPEEYVDGFVALFPKYMRPKTKKVLQDSGCSLRNWAWAQALAMLIVGTLASIALLVVGSKDWVFLGIATGMLEIIPYFGSITALAAVTLITAAADPSSLLKTVIAFVLVLALEGNVIIPIVMKGKVRLPPIHLLVLMAVLGEWFGVFGFLMAAPTLAVARTIHELVIQPRLDHEVIPPSEIPEEPVDRKIA